MSKDTVHIGSFSIDDQLFAEVSLDQEMSELVADGILGLGFPRLAVYDIPPVYYSMFQKVDFAVSSLIFLIYSFVFFYIKFISLSN